jgi:hypothetical protein
MTSTAPSTKDTARKPRIALTGQRGTYRVESQTTPGVFYTTTAARCSCPARKPCKHMHYVKGLNRAFFTKKEATAPVAPVAPVARITGIAADLAAAERLLAIKRRALVDAHPQSDEYAPLLRQVQQAERAYAAFDSRAMRAA